MSQQPVSKPGPWLMLLVAGVVWLLDQASKLYVVRNLALGEIWAPIPSLERFFTFTRTTNTGAAFGLFPNVGGLFVFIAIGVIIGIIAFYPRLPTEHRIVQVALGLQLGGALGNLTDRLTRGSVVDFLDFKFWPIFNVADCAIVVGVLILAFYLLREDFQPKPAPAAELTAEPPSLPRADAERVE